MDLQPIIPTSKFLDHIKILHLESTNACNAACPQCAREIDPGFDKKNTQHLTLHQIQQLFTVDQIQQLDKMFMCGNYGDPAAGCHTLEIFQYFRSVNPGITLGMNTNGGLRGTDWWRRLAAILNQTKDYVIWSIDGLEDTNHIYRINVNWKKLIENARAFIQAGGNAHWDMLIFKHNEHQIIDAENLAKSLGFRWFRGKVSRRFASSPITFLKPPKTYEGPTVISGKIHCQALDESSVYLSAQGKLYPCCWLGNTEYDINKFGSVKSSWNSKNPVKTCSDTCTTNNNSNSFKNQWRIEKEFYSGNT
jgi:MoaA/NifB/PqqE/SkfB family radical SAM enzyme